MKIAVSSTGDSQRSQADERFGRAAFFLVYHCDHDEWSVVPNEGISQAHGAGLASAQTLIDLGVDVLVTGRCGPKASDLLTSAGIEVVEGFSGTVADAPSFVAQK